MSAVTVPVLAPHEVWEDADEDVEGLLDDWHVAEGDTVEAGQAIASLMIVKTSFDLEAPAAGTIALHVAKGETFGRETVVASIHPVSG